eukprot:363761-Chlamydomonas_euryale.AAC.8
MAAGYGVWARWFGFRNVASRARVSGLMGGGMGLETWVCGQGAAVDTLHMSRRRRMPAAWAQGTPRGTADGQVERWTDERVARLRAAFREAWKSTHTGSPEAGTMRALPHQVANPPSTRASATVRRKLSSTLLATVRRKLSCTLLPPFDPPPHPAPSIALSPVPRHAPPQIIHACWSTSCCSATCPRILLVASRPLSLPSLPD